MDLSGLPSKKRTQMTSWTDFELDLDNWKQEVDASSPPRIQIRRALKRSTVKREWLKKIKKTWKSLGVTANSVALISAQLKTEPFLLIFLKPRFVFLENVDADIETGSRLFLLFYFWARRGELARLAGVRLSFVVLFLGDLCSKSARYGNLNQLGLQVCEIWKS